MKNKQQEKLIIIDFGNSNTKIAEYEIETNNLLEIQNIEKNSTDNILKIFLNEIIIKLNVYDTLKIIYSNVTNFDFEKYYHQNFNYSNVRIFDIKSIFIEFENQQLIHFSHIKGIGIDRLLGLINSYLLYKTNCVTIDFGTAITLNQIDNKGFVRGGQIIPGYFTQLNSLNLSTDKINIDNNYHDYSNDFNKLINLNIIEIIGKSGDNTIDAVSYGIINSICGVITNFIRTNSKENEAKILTNVTFAGSYSLPFFNYFEIKNKRTNLTFHHLNNINITSIINLYNLYPKLFI